MNLIVVQLKVKGVNLIQRQLFSSCLFLYHDILLCVVRTAHKSIKRWSYMAIQNFLSGGYYGKLGATVGQRWKNKRTIRTYVKPANPRTEVQQANRNKFANAVTFAQMGMQMNYYATVFVDPNFTHWNYRMKVARELRNKGLTGLDLIPLYPTSFVPPILIQNVKISSVQGQKHITFSTVGLNYNTDRVLSLMFAIYNENDAFLGYKLYLGYYYASNPGFLEVDVDDIAEINTHCFVRVVSNDDTDSTVDMIASPNLAVEQGSKEIRDFNTAIREVQKSAVGIKVIFEEHWKGTPTENEITITANFISNGATATATATSTTLTNENGYCSVLVQFATSDNQHLPAFPNGSNFVVTSVTYGGSTWQFVKENDTVQYSDADLTRTISSSPTWDTSSQDAISFAVPFGGTVESGSQSMQMICSGRFDNRSAIAQMFNYETNGTNIVFTCVGDYKISPMMTDGDKITLPAMQFVSNGVTYTLATQDVNLRNAITVSLYLDNAEVTKAYFRDGGGSVGESLVSLNITIGNVQLSEQPMLNGNWIEKVTTKNGNACVPGYCDIEAISNYANYNSISITAILDGEPYSDEIDTTCQIVLDYTYTRFIYKRITYFYPTLKKEIGGFTVKKKTNVNYNYKKSGSTKTQVF